MTVHVQRDGAITTITLDRPEVMNAFDRAHYAAVNDAIAAFEADDDARVGIIQSNVERAFSVGVDLKDLNKAMAEERLGREELAAKLALTIGKEGAVRKPLVAAMNGYCVGEGLGLALFCDMRVAADNATFSLPEVKRGITTVRATIRLPQIIGLGHAFELLMTGEPKDAQWAEKVGLVNAVVPYADLPAAARKMAEVIAEASPKAVQNIKELALKSYNMSLDDAVALGLQMRNKTSRQEYTEGASAFIEKRKTDF